MNHPPFPNSTDVPPGGYPPPATAGPEPVPMNESPPTTGKSREELLMRARDSTTTPFDFVIVGSGAGGGPLACRLARAGKRVLLIEAGQDPAKSKSVDFPKTPRGELHDVPGFQAAATEDQEMSWQFSVRHYADNEKQGRDQKYTPFSWQRDRNGEQFQVKRDDAAGTGGIFYPRSAGLGGCTGHNAMIVIRPNDCDWDHIADLTGDPSWRAAAMNPYFAKFERCLYVDEYRGFLGRIFGPLSKALQAVIHFVNPQATDDRGGHGGPEGWQPTSFLAPELIQRFVQKDKPLIKILIAAVVVATGTNRLVAAAKRFLVQFGAIQPFDPNDTRSRKEGGEGVFLIPTAFESGTANDVDGNPLKGKRSGVREFILRTQRDFPEHLVVEESLHVTRVLFAIGKKAPQAIGVRCQRGKHLFKASPLHGPNIAEEPFDYFTKGEVILCGGSFNTPQLLMLSGIGDRGELRGNGITGLRWKGDEPLLRNDGMPYEPVHLEGVGKNLQDRYEVSVISEMKEDFAALKEDELSFIPGDANDRGQIEWQKKKSGLYAGNGGTLAIIRRSSQADGPEPDLFTFGAPVAFRGYHWGWSEQLLRSTIRPYYQKIGANDPPLQRKLWSWIILKAYTRNNGGTVRLRSDNPYDPPAICFNSFDDSGCPDWEKDVIALMEAVREARAINAKARELHEDLFANEIQPGPALTHPDPDQHVDLDSPLAEWIKSEAWGHHACGTCRIGADNWCADTNDLLDKGAVLDSSFRVHGVEGLRVVDASVFPKIPGYFILAPVFMISEKAADAILLEGACESYPAAFEDREARAVIARRQRAHPACPPKPAADPTGGLPPEDELATLPENTIGLALSGGGIRSATFALGLLQALAKADRLREIDFLSTVSGGGFTGSFLGRLFTRKEVADAPDPCERVRETLENTQSAPLRWLRTQANYLFASGPDDVKSHLAVFFRNFLTVHLIIGTLIYGIFALFASVPAFLAWLGDLRGLGGQGKSDFVNWAASLPGQKLFTGAARFLMNPPAIPGTSIILSPWWWLPVLALGAGVLPGALGYWLAPKNGATRVHPFFSLLAWIILIAGTIVSLILLPDGWRWAGGAAGLVLGLSWLWQEAARWGIPRGASRPRGEGAIVRNRMTRSLGAALAIFAGLVGWVALDTFAILTADQSYTVAISAVMAALLPVMPYLNKLADFIMRLKEPSGKSDKMKSFLSGATNFAGPVIALALLFYVDVLAHEAFLHHQATPWAWLSVILALAFSAAVGRAFDFLNFSTLSAAYGNHITRTFQGASNEARIYPTADASNDVQVSHPGDDLALHLYHPEAAGGPLHLINVCINQTVEEASQRQVRDAKGLPMSVGPCGVAVGSRFFAVWDQPDRLPKWMQRRLRREGLDGDDTENLPTALDALPASNDPNGFHPLASIRGEKAAVESLTLGEWIALSGAAFSTGVGRGGSLQISLFMGLVNFRLGRWWNSGILRQERPGSYPLNFWRKLKRLPLSLFRMQSLLLSEWNSRFHGPNQWHWHLSDGGHFEVTGAYELIRRRLPLIIISDAGADPDYRYSDLAVLLREVREDFSTEIDWLPAGEAEDDRANHALLRDWIREGSLGELKSLGRAGTHHAALARISYTGGKTGWLLLLKPSLSGDEVQDTREYSVTHDTFPQQPTVDQVFDSAQWESYRNLGLHVGEKVILDRPSI